MSKICCILKTRTSITFYCIYLLISILIPGFLFSPTLYSGEFYKWTDENGDTHISDAQPIESSYEGKKHVQTILITDSPRDEISSEQELPPPIEFASPPGVIMIPETNVYVVPHLGEDMFFYGGWWWRPWGERWYRSRHYSSGWVYYEGVPSFHARIPSGWRDDYNNSRWRGHQWNYQQISYQQLQRNWSSRKESRDWEKQQTLGAQGLKPRTQQSSRAVHSKLSQPQHREKVKPQQQTRPQDREAPQRSKP